MSEESSAEIIRKLAEKGEKSAESSENAPFFYQSNKKVDIPKQLAAFSLIKDEKERQKAILEWWDSLADQEKEKVGRWVKSTLEQLLNVFAPLLDFMKAIEASSGFNIGDIDPEVPVIETEWKNLIV